ncbi:MAG: 50S ribosomal protein L25 [Lachnospiraceae bacterium]|nr:50S ribosomal protein L25 [Lachnospiraceae bacterium]
MNTLKAERRSMDVKAKRLRREGYVTGSVFGRQIEGSIPIKILKADAERLLKTSSKGSQIMLEVDGQPYDVLIKAIDYNGLAGVVNEIDFQALVSTEKVHSVAEVIFVNHDKVASGVLQESLKEISYKALPAALVEKVKVDVGEMKIGDIIRVKDLDIANDKDIDLLTDLDAVVVSVTAVHNSVPEEEEKEEETAE